MADCVALFAGVTLSGLAFDHGGPAWLLLPTVVGLPLAAWVFARVLQRHTGAARRPAG